MKRAARSLTGKMAAAVVCLLLVVWFEQACSFELVPSRTELTYSEEESLELRCLHVLEEAFLETEIVAVTEMRVVKRVGRRGWHALASVRLGSRDVRSQVGLDVVGHIGHNATDSFLSVVWYNTTVESLGVYRCDVVGTDKNNDLVLEKTNVLTVFEESATLRDRLLVSHEQLEDLQLEFNRFRKDTREELVGLRGAVEELQATVRRLRDGEVATEKWVTQRIEQQLEVGLRDGLGEIVSNITGQLDSCACGGQAGVAAVDSTGQPGGKGGGGALVAGQITGATTQQAGATVATTRQVGAAVSTTAAEGKTSNAATTPTSLVVQTTVESVGEPDEADYGNATLTWPSGRFGLLMPESGCPESSEAGGSSPWESGAVSYHTESVDENRDNASSPIHLAQPIFEVDASGDHFVHMHFCVKGQSRLPPAEASSADVDASNSEDDQAEAAVEIQWPAGSYCILRKGGHCPDGFGSGYLDIDEEDTKHVKKFRGALPDMLFFCCRGDGDASRAVYLPRDKPFFLYRYGGRCQAVRDMRVLAESVTLDTENVNNSNGYENDFHPDGCLEDVTLELCYYY